MNPSAFAAPAYGFFGNATNGFIPGPRDMGFSVAIYKTFPIRNRLSSEFRCEAFNVVNHPSFGGIDTGIGPYDPTPGLVNSPSDPRILEMVGRQLPINLRSRGPLESIFPRLHACRTGHMSSVRLQLLDSPPAPAGLFAFSIRMILLFAKRSVS
jgi:hypothetical protein